MQLKFRVVEAVLQCTCAVLKNTESVGVFKGDSMLWQSACELVLGQLLPRFPPPPEVVSAALLCLVPMADHCPSPEYAPFLLNASVSQPSVLALKDSGFRSFLVCHFFAVFCIYTHAPRQTNIGFLKT